MATVEGGYHRVQGLVRGLAILEALNLRPGSTASVIELSRSTRLHRTTVKRLLETLRHVGYVRYRADTDTYCLTYRIRQLADNVRDDLWISEIASPVLRRLTAKILWPSDLATLEEDELVVRDSTHPFTPLSFTRGVFGRRLPMLKTAVGRAYLAFCPKEEREILIGMHRERKDAQGINARALHDLRKTIKQTRERGYAINERGEGLGSGRFGAVAIPIRVRERVMGCLNIVFLMRAISFKEIVDRHLPDLRAAVDEIERTIIQRQAGKPKRELSGFEHDTLAVGGRGGASRSGTSSFTN